MLNFYLFAVRIRFFTAINNNFKEIMCFPLEQLCYFAVNVGKTLRSVLNKLPPSTL